MKKRDFILIFIIIFLAAAVWGITYSMSSGDSAQLLISVDDHLYGVYDLSEDQRIRINDTNECLIQDGSVSMVSADCPDKICVHSAHISRSGQTIICMPNRVVLEVINGDSSQIDTMTE